MRYLPVRWRTKKNSASFQNFFVRFIFARKKPADSFAFHSASLHNCKHTNNMGERKKASQPAISRCRESAYLCVLFVSARFLAHRKRFLCVNLACHLFVNKKNRNQIEFANQNVQRLLIQCSLLCNLHLHSVNHARELASLFWKFVPNFSPVADGALSNTRNYDIILAFQLV